VNVPVETLLVVVKVRLLSKEIVPLSKLKLGVTPEGVAPTQAPLRVTVVSTPRVRVTVTVAAPLFPRMISIESTEVPKLKFSIVNSRVDEKVPAFPAWSQARTFQ
jgi:hypothetical protein